MSVVVDDVRRRYAHLRGALSVATHPRRLDASCLYSRTTRW